MSLSRHDACRLLHPRVTNEYYIRQIRCEKNSWMKIFGNRDQFVAQLYYQCVVISVTTCHPAKTIVPPAIWNTSPPAGNQGTVEGAKWFMLSIGASCTQKERI